ncbi:MAG TPA: rhodanese-like domain-containing protein, partial [Pyrinomonadaceae bacterium]|nr:rhodanese-like domain-containing protein [Pyrinomonadaceae bacterium]
QRKFNYALKPMTREEFIKVVAADQPEVPAYFPVSAAQNLKGSSSLDDLTRPIELSSDEIVKFDGIVLDVRQNSDYGSGHIPNSINIGLGGQFATWAGTMVPIGTHVAIVAETQEQVDEAFMRLARVGIETVKGFVLTGNYDGEKKIVEQVSVQEVAELTETEKFIQFVDVRRPAEHSGDHAVRTINIPLERLSREIDKLDPATPTYVICQSGFRSSIGTSILENAGFAKIYNVTGGTKAWIDAELPTELSAATGKAN